jgi:hypothetical protein
MSASAMATFRIIRSSFSARIKSWGAVKLAATVWPGSMLRVRMMPSMGAFITAFSRSFSQASHGGWN